MGIVCSSILLNGFFFSLARLKELTLRSNRYPGYRSFSLYNYAVFITKIITLIRPCSQGLACPDDEICCRYRLSRQEAKGACSVIRPVWLRKVSN